MKTFFLIPAGALLMMACNDNPQTIQQSQRDAIIDSMVSLRMGDIARQAAEDLDRRRAIEVKAKADSIVAALDSIKTSPADNTASHTRNP